MKNINPRKRIALYALSLFSFLTVGCKEDSPITSTLEISESSATLTYAMEAGSRIVNITSNQKWVATSNQTWCNVTPAMGTNDGSITIAVTENNTTADRNATVTISTTENSTILTKTINVKQSVAAAIKISFLNVNTNAKIVELFFANNISFKTNLDINQSVSVPGIGNLMAAKFYHVKDSATVVDWYNSQDGTTIKTTPVNIDLNGFAGGTGSEATPFLVANPRQLYNTRVKVSGEGKYFKQINDIDLTDACGIYPNADKTGWDDSKANANAPFYNNKLGWNKMEDYNVRMDFTGYYDGGNFKIIGLRTQVALFYRIKGTLKNLIIDNTSFSTGMSSMVNFASAYNQSGLIENCTNNGYVYNIILEPTRRFEFAVSTIAAIAEEGVTINKCTNNTTLYISKKNMGGGGPMEIGTIVGRSENATIQNCTNNGDIINNMTKGGDIGGMVGLGSGTMTNLINNGNITDNPVDIGGGVGIKVIGGICGIKEAGIIENCTNNGKINITPITNTDYYSAAGIAGWLSGNSATALSIIKNCSNKGAVTANGAKELCGIANTTNAFFYQILNSTNEAAVTNPIGSAAGIASSLNGNPTNTILSNCFNKGDITGNAPYVAGIVMSMYNGLLENCTNSGNIVNIWVNDPGVSYGTIGHPITGGIAALATGGIMKNVTNSGKVSGGIGCGGIIGGAWSITINGANNIGSIIGLPAAYDANHNQTHRYAGQIAGYTLNWGDGLKFSNIKFSGSVTGDQITDIQASIP